jgi:hypothetical protein
VDRSSFPILGNHGKLRIWGIVLGLCLTLIAWAGPPQAAGGAHPSKCRNGTVQVKVGKNKTCLSRKLVLPPPSKSNALVARAQAALTFTELSFKTPSGKSVKSFSQELGPSWMTARRRLEKALTKIIALQQRTAAHRPIADYFARASPKESADCAILDIIGNATSFTEPGEGGKTVQLTSSASVDGATVTLGMDSSGLHFGLSAKVNGETYTAKYDSGDLACLAYKLPPCPNGDGSLNAYGLKGKVGFSLTVARGGKVLKSMSYSKTTAVDTKGQVADDAKLDSVDVTYSETTNTVLDGIHLTQYGNRTTRINMRTGGYDPGESVSFGSANAGGEYVNVAGIEADAKDFASFVNETISSYRNREKAWQSANACAKLTFNPGSETLTLVPGQQGNFSAEVDAKANGERAAKASWTLGAQQNGTFSPTSSKDGQPSFSYEVAGSPSGETLSVVVKVTSSAGVAEGTWLQKLKPTNTISGTFNGHEDLEGISYDWSGTATFSRISSQVGGSIFTLSSGQATVNVSGTGPDGCTHSGTEVIPLAAQGVMTVLGTSKPYKYDFTAPWDNTYQGGGVTVSCPEQQPEPRTEIPTAAALQSGEIGLPVANPSELNPSGLLKTSPDGVTFADSASEHDPVVGAANWNWSLKAS